MTSAQGSLSPLRSSQQGCSHSKTGMGAPHLQSPPRPLSPTGPPASAEGHPAPYLGGALPLSSLPPSQLRRNLSPLSPENLLTGPAEVADTSQNVLWGNTGC